MQEQGGRQLSQLALATRESGDRRVEEVAEERIVERDDGDVFGHAKTRGPSGLDRADGERVARRDEPGRANGQGEELERRRLAALDRPNVVAESDVLRRDCQFDRSHRGAEAVKAFDPRRELRRGTDVGDALVPVADEM